MASYKEKFNASISILRLMSENEFFKLKEDYIPKYITSLCYNDAINFINLLYNDYILRKYLDFSYIFTQSAPQICKYLITHYPNEFTNPVIYTIYEILENKYELFDCSLSVEEMYTLPLPLEKIKELIDKDMLLRSIIH